MNRARVAGMGLRWMLALAFAVAAGLKIGTRGTWSAGGAHTLFGALPGALQWALVVVELALAGWLVSAARARWAALATIVLLSIFLAAVLVEAFGQGRSCGCFGDMPEKPWVSLGLDGVLLAMAVGAYLLGEMFPRQGGSR